ncbi:MAG: SDR family NAD(P)-dependent oxidoreductase, partial [Candidatus Latescibacterota bacterium]
MNARRLAGQVAWISGGASGMGQATAELFSAEGARVAVADVQHDRGREVVERIRGAGGEAIYLPCDVGREDEVRDAIAETVSSFGGLQILVNNAGVVHVAPLEAYAEADWDRLMSINLKSIFFAVKHGIEHLRRARRSYVVNLGSVASFVGQPRTPAYTASKHAVLGLTRSIALDYAADGLRCNCVCPGITDTPMLRFHLSTSPDPEATL